MMGDRLIERQSPGRLFGAGEWIGVAVVDFLLLDRSALAAVVRLAFGLLLRLLLALVALLLLPLPLRD